MFNKKTKLKLTDFECNLLWGGMNNIRHRAAEIVNAELIYV